MEIIDKIPMQNLNSSISRSIGAIDKDDQRCFVALRNFKNTEQQYDQLHNRIRILKHHDETYIKKMAANESRIQKLQKIKNQSKKEHHQFSEIKKAEKQQADLKKKKNQLLKESIVKQTEANRKSLCKRKEGIRQEMANQSKFNHRKIMSVQLQNFEQKKRKRDMIFLAESRGKENIIQFQNKKYQAIHETQQKQRASLQAKQKQKLQQIDQLTRIEMAMVQKSSQSQQAFKSVKKRLDTMLGQIRNNKISVKHPIKEVENKNHFSRSESFYIVNQMRQ